MGNTGKFFCSGERYRVRKNFSAGSTFLAGEILVFESSGFSWHDEAQMYCFRRESDGVEKGWLLREAEPLGVREEYFERLVAG
jgi:hypothetical protein